MSTTTTTYLPTRRAILLAPVVAVLAAGCTSERDEPADDAELVTSWSESRFDWVAEITPVAPAVLSTAAQVDRWVEESGIDPEAAAEAMTDVDLTTRFVVVGGYPRCQEYRVVGVTDDGGVTFTVRTEDERVSCAWSPYTIDVWSVPLAATGGTAPSRVTTTDG